MSDPKMTDPNAPQPQAGATEPGAQPNNPETAPPAAEPGLEQLKAIIGLLQTDLEAAKTERLRLVADMDNLRKRLEREKLETAKFAISKFAVDIVGVADNFERAMQAVPAGAAEADPALASLVEGVGMIEIQLKAVLEKHGVKRIWPEGELLNPHLHQAVMQQNRPDVPHGTILQVFQAGYVIDDRIIRAATVVTASGGPKVGKTAEATGTAGTSEPPPVDDPSNSE